MNNRSLSIVLLVFTIFSACKRPPVKSVPPPSPTSTIAKKVNVRDIDFDYFKSKSKVTYTDASTSLNATVDIRMQKDSIIWLSINKIGIEGVRSLITRDSIFVLDRLNNEYLVYDFPSLSKRFNFPITFELLQSIIMGNLPQTEKPDYQISVLKAEDLYLLRQSHDSITIDNYVGLNDLKLKKILVVEKPSNNTIVVQYENFTALNNFLFPYNSSINLNYQSTNGSSNTVVTIQHLKADIADKELKFPFAVPPKYERKQ